MNKKSRLLSLALTAGLVASNLGAIPINVFAADNSNVNEVTVDPANGKTPIADALATKYVEGKDNIFYLKSGEYKEKITIDKPNVSIIGLKDGDKKAVLTGDGKNKKYAKKNADTMIKIQASNVTIDNVEITDLWLKSASNDINPIGIKVYDGVDNIRISNCEIHDMGCKYGNSTSKNWNGHGIIVAGYDDNGNTSKGISNVTIDDCYLHDLTLGQSETLVLNGNVEDFQVYNNRIDKCDNIGIDIIGYEHKQDENDSARKGDIYNNIVTNISSGPNNAYGFEACAGGIYVDGGQYVNIHDNYVEGCDIGIELASEHENRFTDHITVTNNILVKNNELGGISIGGCYEKDKITGYATNCEIKNNTVYNEAGTCFNIQKANDVNNVISNNIFFAANDENASIYDNDKKGENTSNTIVNNLVNLKEYPDSINKKKDIYDESMTMNVNSDTMSVSVNSKKYTADYGANITWGLTSAEPTPEPTTATEPVTESVSEEPAVEPTSEAPAVEPTSEEPALVADPVIEDTDNEGDEPSYDIHDDSKFYGIDESDDTCKITYKKKKSENWKHVNIDFGNVDLTKYSTVKMTVKPSRKLNLGITNQDENNPVFYRNHWNKEGKFTSTKETTLTINLTEDNANGLFLYFDATSNDTKGKDTTFTITDIWFE